jgi:hypothetical protein
MFGKFRREETSIYDVAMNKVLEDMETFGPDDSEFELRLGHLERLAKLKDAEKQKSKVSPDTMALVLGNIATVLLIVAYEQKHVMTTRAKEFILRVK